MPDVSHDLSLGLAHAYSRCKIMFDAKREDNMINHAICLLDQLDKDVNTFAMRSKYVVFVDFSSLTPPPPLFFVYVTF